MSNSSSSRGRLFARCPTPAMPSYDSWYGQAKRLEFDGDLKGAFSAFMEAIARGDRVDSSLKDVAGLLNMVGHVHAAVRFLEDHRGLASNVIGYENLLQRLKMEADRADVLAEAAKVASSSTIMPETIIPTTLRVTATSTPETANSSSPSAAVVGAITPYTCERLFPNPHKIRAIIYLNSSRTDCLVDFGTNSAARKALNVPKLVDDYFIEWATDKWQELCKRLAVHLHLDKEHHNPVPLINQTNGGEDLEKLSSRTRQNYMAAFKNLFDTPTFQRGDELIEELFVQVSNLDHPDEVERISSTQKVDEDDKNIGSTDSMNRGGGESTCDGGASPAMLFMDTPSIKPKTASSGQSTRAIVSPCEGGVGRMDTSPPSTVEVSHSTPKPRPLRLTTLISDQPLSASSGCYADSCSSSWQQQQQHAAGYSQGSACYQVPSVMWPTDVTYPPTNYTVSPHLDGMSGNPLYTGQTVQQHLIQMAAANAAMAQRCAEISAAAVNAVMNTNNTNHTAGTGLYSYPHFQQQQQQQPAAFSDYYHLNSPPPCTPINPRRLVFTTPDTRRHFPSTPSPIVDRSRFS